MIVLTTRIAPTLLSCFAALLVVSPSAIALQTDTPQTASPATISPPADSSSSSTLQSVADRAAQISDEPDDDVTTAVEFTRDLTDRANAAFINTTDESLQLTNFQEVLNEGLALDYLGRFMLGSSRNDLTPAQSERYTKVFPVYITKLYAEQFKDIAGKELTINEATPFGRRDVIVRTQFLKDDGTPVNVDWRARKLKTQGHKMIDIIVSGVSIMTVKREEFSSFIAANGVDALIERLELEAQS